MFEVAKDVWQIPVLPRRMINCYLVGDVLVDAGLWFSAGQIQRALKGRTVSAHVLTHAHLDHQGSTHAICSKRHIPLMCHKDDAEAAITGRVTDTYRDKDSLIARMQQRFLAGRGHPVAKTLAEGDTVADFTVIHTPGHTPGHISLWREHDGMLIAGDAALGMNMATTQSGIRLPPVMTTADMDATKASIHKLAALDPVHVVFGHGMMASGHAFQHFAIHLK